MKIFSLALLLFASAQAEEASGPNVEAVVLLGPQEEVHPKICQGVHAVGLQVPGRFEALKNRLESVFYGKPLTEEMISCLKENIIAYYHSEHHDVVSVRVPEQDVTDGVVQLVVVEGKAGNVRFTGNRWFSSEMLRRQVRLKTGDPIDTAKVADDLFWLNRNPFRTTDAVFFPGNSEGSTDIEFVTRDRFPFRPYIGGDNTGVNATGDGRLFAGFNWGNAFWLDQQLTYQFSKSTDWSRFYAHTAHYSIPLPWRNTITFYGGYSSVHPKMPSSAFKSRGSSAQVSARYDIPIRTFDETLSEFTIGFDYKKTNNNLLFGAAQVLPPTTAIIGQFMAGYNICYEESYVKVPFEIELYWSPGEMLPHQTDSDFGSLRPFATSRYLYTRLMLAPSIKMPWRFFCLLNLRAQWSDRNLLPSEEFGLGGYNTVRGYDERIVNGDNALLASGELHFPSFPLFYMRSSKKNDKLEFLVFLDYGVAARHKAGQGTKKSEFLIGAGPGLRYSFSSHVFIRFDYGWQCRHLSNLIEKRHSKGHVSAEVNY